MATIAKLDSNGVQVLPEGQRGKTTSPQVSSSDSLLPADGKKLKKEKKNGNSFLILKKSYPMLIYKYAYCCS